MGRGGKQRRLQAELPETHNAHDTEDARETSRVDESVHRTHEQPQQRNVVETDQIAEKFAATVASALQMQRNPNKDHSIEWATKLGAKVFTGTSVPAMAEAWMDKIETVFDVMGCPDDKRLRLATFLLEEGANDWWWLIQTRYVDPSVITWFSEYQKKFVELSKYAQVLVADERDRCRRFEDGLREEIRTSVISAEWNFCNICRVDRVWKLVEAALRVEKSISEKHIQRDQMKSEAVLVRQGLGLLGARRLRRIDVGFGQVSPIPVVSKPSLDRAKVQDLVMVQYSSQLIAILRVRALLREFFVQDRVRVLVVGHLKRHCPAQFQEGGRSQMMLPQASVGASRHDQNQNTGAGKTGGSTGV
ncbi:Gag protease polyprotein-like protein [Abeliophyllum distichum]|uniref:Gag protease polyprotein-like protein n=1 Tax=Abeliophyllum distichum TaxID=126358 RepID=A0ABD1Q684_9LAMI